MTTWAPIRCDDKTLTSEYLYFPSEAAARAAATGPHHAVIDLTAYEKTTKVDDEDDPDGDHP